MSLCQSLMQKFQEQIKEIKYYWLFSYLWTVSRLKTFFHCKLLEVLVWDYFFGPTTGTHRVPNPEGKKNYCQILKETQQVWSHHYINPCLSQFCCMVSLSRPLFRRSRVKNLNSELKCVKNCLGQAFFQLLVQVRYLFDEMYKHLVIKFIIFSFK